MIKFLRSSNGYCCRAVNKAKTFKARSQQSGKEGATQSICEKTWACTSRLTAVGKNLFILDILRKLKQALLQEDLICNSIERKESSTTPRLWTESAILTKKSPAPSSDSVGVCSQEKKGASYICVFFVQLQKILMQPFFFLRDYCGHGKRRKILIRGSEGPMI